MATSTAVSSVYVMNLLGLSMVFLTAYFIMVFAILVIAGWALIKFLRPIYHFINHD